jgi:hypothetical protein
MIGRPSFYVNEADLGQVLDREPDYIAFGINDAVVVDLIYRSTWPYPPIVSLLCDGRYGIVYDDAIGRMILARGAPLSANAEFYWRFRLGPPQPCPGAVQRPIPGHTFAREAELQTRTAFPSVVRSDEMFPESVTAASGREFVQRVHLPDYAFRPGTYQIHLAGAWPWRGGAAYRIRARILVGGRMIGQAIAAGDQPLEYGTPPFAVSSAGTRPVIVEIEVETPPGAGPSPQAFTAWRARALNLIRGAIVSRLSP